MSRLPGEHVRIAVPIDREDTLKRAEKLLRQGRLDAAVGEYARVVEEYPRDWNTANLLGDLYVRAGQGDRAAEQFTRIADHLAAEGFLPKASAVYKKTLRIRPDDEHVLLQLGDIAARQGILADAKQFLGSVVERRRLSGDRAGMAKVLVRLAAIDPTDLDLQLRAARAAFEAGDRGTAGQLLREAASEYETQGREADALAVLNEVLRLDPTDAAARGRVIQAQAAAGDLAGARRLANGPAELVALASVLDDTGRGDEALDVLAEAARLTPDDLDLRRRLVRRLAERGRTTELAGYLTLDTAADDPELLRLCGVEELRAGRMDAGRVALARSVELSPGQGRLLVAAARDFAAVDSEAALACIDVLAEAHLAHGEYEAAAEVLHEYVSLVPSDVAALMRLVEVCVDGALDSRMASAQARLADAYLTTGRAAEARVIAEDLAARDPRESAHVERYRRALVMLGEPDPDRLIAERLSGDSPFLGTADLVEGDPLELPPAADDGRLVDAAGSAFTSAAPPVPGRSAAVIELDDQEALAEREDPIELTAVEIDLSSVLEDLQAVAPPAARAAERPENAGARPAASLESIFDAFRAEAAGSTDADARQQHDAGVGLLQEGKFDEGVRALETAARAPRWRFAAASRLGRAWLARGDAARGIEWLERAAEAPAAAPQEQLALLYDLGDALERAGESARALAVFLEVEANAGVFRDVAARIERLSRL